MMMYPRILAELVKGSTGCAYPVNEGKLWCLGGVGFGATLAFSMAAGLLGSYMELQKTWIWLAASAETVAYWEAMKDVAFGACSEPPRWVANRTICTPPACQNSTPRPRASPFKRPCR